MTGRGDQRRTVTWRDQALKNFGVWLAVYPAVLISSYMFSWLAPGGPLWLEILISTAFTVPLISYVAVPWVEKRLAHAKGETAAEFKHQEADQAEGGPRG
jgi:antibiotic biosynthesis monooxygenase (ABM) superfamily enzyme